MNFIPRNNVKKARLQFTSEFTVVLNQKSSP